MMPVDGDELEADELETAIAEFLVAEDSGNEFDVGQWLDLHPNIADELVKFLEDHYRARRALQLNALSGSTLEDTIDFAYPVNDSKEGEVLQRNAYRTKVAGYRFLRLLGQGGMGRVYEASDDQEHRCAIKLLAPQWVSQPGAMERFKQEGLIASSLNHPRCVFVQAVDEDEGQPYIVMELMSGRTLRDLVVENGPLSIGQAVQVIVDVIDGLQAAHDLGLIHRDVKPANCYLEQDGRVKIGDFGLSRFMDVDSGLTRTGNVVGTPLYASPEQLRSEDLDVRTDIYSLCATFYYLLVGKAPFEHSNAATVIARVSSEDPKPIRSIRKDVPKALEQVIMQGLNRSRDKRPKNLDAVREMLEPFLPGRQPIKTLGLRFAAYAVDVAIFSIIAFSIVGFIGHQWEGSRNHIRPTLFVYLCAMVPQLIYFLLLESLTGASLGKLLMRLRVRSCPGLQRASLLQCLVRALVWWLLAGVSTDLLLYAFFPQAEMWNHIALQWSGFGICYTINMAPMLIRKDQRMLHDLLSSTEVRSLPNSKRDTAAKIDGRIKLQVPLGPTSWKRIGRFEVSGEISRHLDDVWVAGHDPRLNRDAWILLRPKSEDSISTIRRQCARFTRLRWIGCGVSGDYQWDAFLAPRGVPLKRSSSDWENVRKALFDIATEIDQSRSDHLAIPTLDIGSVVVDHSGNVVWIDDPTRHELDSHQTSMDAVVEHDWARERNFLNDVAIEMLSPQDENKRADATSCLPLHARRIMDRLSGSNKQKAYASVKELLTELNACIDRPAAVTFNMRLIQSMILLSFGLAPIGVLLSIIGLGDLLRLSTIEDELLKVRAVQSISANDDYMDAFVDSLSVEDRDRIPSRRLLIDMSRSCEAFLFEMHRRQLSYFTLFDKLNRQNAGIVSFTPSLLDQLLPSVRTEDAFRFEWHLPETLQVDSDGGTDSRDVKIGQVGRELFSKHASLDASELLETIDKLDRTQYPIVMPLSLKARIASLTLTLLAIAGLWGGIWKGGFSAGLAGLAIVDRNGRPLGRLRHFIRSLLLWLPFWLLVCWVVVNPLIESPFTAFSLTFKRFFIVVPFAYLAIALWMRTRGPHDFIMGTRVVTK